MSFTPSVVFNKVGGGTAIVNGDSVAMTGTTTFGDKNVGTSKGLNVSGTGLTSGNYQLTAVGGSGNITARSLTVTATGQNKVYDGTTTATATLADNRVSGDVLTLGGTAAFQTRQVGNNKNVDVTSIAVTGTDSGNYTWNTTASTTGNVTVRNLTITTTASNKVYDATTITTGTLASDKVSGDTVTLAATGYTFDTANVGTGKQVTAGGLTISGADGGNYSLTNTSATTTANITQRPITVTADARSKIYGDADPSLTYVVGGSGLVGGDSLSGALARNAGESVGSQGITQGNLVASGNYVLTFNANNLTISPALLTVTADAKSRVYGNANPSLTYTTSGFKFTDNASLLSGSLTTSAAAASVVGTYGIAQGTVAANGNYTISYTPVNLTVTTAPLTVTANNASKMYGEANPTLSAAIAGFKNGETLGTSGVTGAAALATPADSTTAVGSVAITPSVGTLSAGRVASECGKSPHFFGAQEFFSVTAGAAAGVL